MKTRVGLWIDHRKALIVALTDKGQVTRLVISKVDKQLGRSSGIRSTTRYEPLQVPADDSREKKLTTSLTIYYRAVIASIRDAESILVFGPGEAKGELEKRLQRDGLGARIVGMETVDKMTDRQIAAKVRAYFEKKQGQGQKADANAKTHRRKVIKAEARGAGRRAAMAP
jgi:hypothetical protein